MGLGFTVYTDLIDFTVFKQILEKLAVANGLGLFQNDASAAVHFCKLGDLNFYYKPAENESEENKGYVTGDCQTNLLGAGFHKAAIDFIDKLQRELDAPLEVEDETAYYDERDFEKMKTDHFYKWLEKVFDLISEQEAKGGTDLCACWDLFQYMPETQKGVVVTPFGSFRLTEVAEKIRNKGFDSFARDFFIWNDPEKDARFHRGLALHALWEDCYFMPSQRSDSDSEINDYIIRELEQAATLDPTLPFPKNEYETVCRLHGYSPISTDGIPEYKSDFIIGYRRGIVTYKIGNLKFKLPGLYLKDYDDNTVIYYDNAPVDWHVVRITAYSIDGNPEFIDMDDPIVAEGDYDGGKYRIYDLGMSQDAEDEEPYPTYSCHVLGKNQFSLLTLCGATQEALDSLAQALLASLSMDKPIENNKLTY